MSDWNSHVINIAAELKQFLDRNNEFMIINIGDVYMQFLLKNDCVVFEAVGPKNLDNCPIAVDWLVEHGWELPTLKFSNNFHRHLKLPFDVNEVANIVVTTFSHGYGLTADMKITINEETEE
jgi:hypothetical protein